MKSLAWFSVFAWYFLVPVRALSGDLTPGTLDAHWDAGASTCPPGKPPEPVQVYRYNAQTLILRENLCSTWEAPFMYLLIGNKQALLIDTGDVADPQIVPLKALVEGLLPGEAAGMRLIVVHSHGHLDHRAGDPQFAQILGIQLVPSDLQHVRDYFAFRDWPNGSAQIDLGDRIVDVLPAPGHHPAQLVYYDRNTRLVFSGDFLLPGRILVDDLGAYEASALRVAEFLKVKPVSYVLGGHIEKTRAGELLPWQATYHPDEHALQLSKSDLMALPAALHNFNGFYSESGQFVVENPIRNLIAVAAATAIVLIVLGVLLYRYIQRKRRALVKNAHLT